MVKRRAYQMIEKVLIDAKGEWLPAKEIMVRANLLLPSRSTIMVGSVGHWVKVLVSRNQVEKRQFKVGLYRWKQEVRPNS